MNTISKRLILATSVGVACVFLILAFYILRSSQAAREENRVFIQSLQESLSTTLMVKGSTVQKAASSIAQNSYTEKYFTSENMTDRISTSRIVNNFALYIMESNPDILSIALFNPTRLPLTAGTALDSVLLSAIRRAYPDYLSDDSVQPFEGFFTRVFTTSGAGRYYAYVMPIYSTTVPVPLTRIATCIVLCDARQLDRLMDQTVPSLISDIRLYGAQDELMAARRGGVKALKIQNRFYAQIPAANWRLEIDVDWSRPMADRLSSSTMLLMALMSCALLLSIVLILHFNLVRPVKLLIGQLDGLVDYHALTLHFDNELDVVVDTIRGMLRRLEELTKARIAGETQVYALQLHAKQAELSALQSQINPHFLYNTLECMRSIGLYYEAPEIVSISSAMAAIFRYSIKGAPYVKVEEELCIVRQYLNIIDVRFDGRFHATMDFTSEAMACIIPKMVLQPLVENAIYHGLEPKRGAGTLTLRGRVHNGTLYLTVEDDGQGMEPEELAALHRQLAAGMDMARVDTSARSIGLSNINQRLHLMAGDSCRLEVTSRRNAGACVCLRIPQVHTAPQTRQLG